MDNEGRAMDRLRAGPWAYGPSEAQSVASSRLHPVILPPGGPRDGPDSRARMGEDQIEVAARFNFPVGVAVDSAGNVYVAGRNNSTIRKVTPTGTTTTVVGTAGVAGVRLRASTVRGTT